MSMFQPRLLLVSVALLDVIALGCLGVPAAVGRSSSSRALAQCGPTSQYNYQEGYQWLNSPNWGSRALLVNQPADLCTSQQTVSNFSTAWTMVASQSTQGYAQSGYLGSWGQYQRNFSEWDANDGTGFHRILASATGAYGTSTGYAQFFDPACLCIRLFAGLTQLDQTSAGILNNWSGLRNIFDGETVYNGSDVPGPSANQAAAFQALEVEQAFTTQWSYPPNTSVFSAIDSNRYCKSGFYLDSFLIWTC